MERTSVGVGVKCLKYYENTSWMLGVVEVRWDGGREDRIDFKNIDDNS